MIPRDAIAHWRSVAPWTQDAQVEQDLVLSRALVEVFREPALAGALLLRGGTALHKLHPGLPARYSEDIDLVQAAAGGIGVVIDAMRSRLDPLLGKPRREMKGKNVILRYQFESEIPPVVPLRLKIEINTREHFAVFGRVAQGFRVRSPWFDGESEVGTFTLEELLATKLRALYQRRKGRDLFDLWLCLTKRRADPAKVVEAFGEYMRREGRRVSRAEFEENLDEKVGSRAFQDDLRPLLAADVPYDVEAAEKVVKRELIGRV